MNKVFIVVQRIQHRYQGETATIIAVFAKEEKASAYCDKHNAGRLHYEYDYEEMEVEE